MTTTTTAAEPAWKKFLKLKSDVPVAAANLADTTGVKTLKRKRDPLPPVLQKPHKSAFKGRRSVASSTADDVAEKKVRANKQKKKARTKTKRSKKEEAEAKAARTSALAYLALYRDARAEWKFSKPRQNYLLKHAFDGDVVPEERVGDLLLYLRDVQGAARERCLDGARVLIARFERQGVPKDGQGQGEGAAAEVVDGGGVSAGQVSDGRQEEEDEEEEEDDVTDEQVERARMVEAALVQQEGSDEKTPSAGDGDAAEEGEGSSAAGSD